MARSHSPTISAGHLRGRRLEVPPGRSVRPTRSLVRQALFNMLGDRVVDAIVLDLYSGSGAMGLEAVSRGAARVVMVERSAATLAVLRRNLAACAVEADRVLLVPADARRIDPTPYGPFDVVLADPPFELTDALPPELGAPGVVRAGGVLVFHAPSERSAPRAGPGWRLDRSRTYGRSAVHVFLREE